MDNKKRNILFISAWYPDRINPNLGNFVEKHANAIAQNCNVNVLHVAFDTEMNDKRFELVSESENNINVVRVYIKKKFYKIFPFNILQKIYLYLKAYNMGYKFIVSKYGNQDLTHANILFPTGLIALYFKWRYNLQYIITEHWTGYLPDDPSEISMFQKFLAKKVVCNARFITPVSRDLKRAMLVMCLKGKYKVIPNVVDVNIFKPKLDKVINTKVRFLHVSSLDDNQKNITGLIKAASKLSSICNNFELFIVGDGDNSSYINYCEQLNVLNSTIFFESEKKPAEIAMLMQQADCFVMFSNYESFSVVIAEALACGLPIIATNAGGISSELTKDFGIIIKPNDEAALMLAMANMMELHNEYDRLQLSAYAAKYSYENVGMAFYNLYKEILN